MESVVSENDSNKNFIPVPQTKNLTQLAEGEGKEILDFYVIEKNKLITYEEDKLFRVRSFEAGGEIGPEEEIFSLQENFYDF